MNSENSYQPEIDIFFKEEMIDGQLWLITIFRDNGIGWSWDEMPERVWEKYHHAQRNIEKMGGTFNYHAEYGIGAEIRIKLPVKDLQTSKLYKQWIQEAILKRIAMKEMK